jgi:hypothetical protein
MMYRHPFLAYWALFHPFFPVLFLAAMALQIVLIVIPTFMILRKMGYGGWWSLITCLPFGKAIGLWILATTTWPAEARTAASGAPKGAAR